MWVEAGELVGLHEVDFGGQDDGHDDAVDSCGFAKDDTASACVIVSKRPVKLL